jgi:hypothetical protein
VTLRASFLQDYPGGRHTGPTHFRCTLPPGEHSGFPKAKFVREFPNLPQVEGIAITEGGRFFYVTDEDEGGASTCGSRVS